MATLYRTLDGATFEADSAEELVDRLRADSRTPTASRAAFMREAAVRARVQTGHVVRAGDAAAFVADLIVAGLLTVKG